MAAEVWGPEYRALLKSGKVTVDDVLLIEMSEDETGVLQKPTW